MADRPTEPKPQTETDRKVPHETKPHPDQGRPSTSTGDSTRATEARTGLGSDTPQKSNTLRMVLIGALVVLIVVIIVGLLA